MPTHPKSWQVGIQTIPPSEALLANMPSGREYHTPRPFVTPALEEDVIIRMRAPPDPADTGFEGEQGNSSDDDLTPNEPVGAFPGTKGDYSGGTSYY